MTLGMHSQLTSCFVFASTQLKHKPGSKYFLLPIMDAYNATYLLRKFEGLPLISFSEITL